MRTVNKATHAGVLKVQANVYHLDFDGGKIVVFVEANRNVLSHFASGRRICALPIASLAKYQQRDVAQEELDRTIAKAGVDKARLIFSEHPTINP